MNGSEKKVEVVFAVRRMSLCEYATLQMRGVINDRTAPFAVMGGRDQSDCIPPTVPAEAIMLWPSEAVAWYCPEQPEPQFGPQFGPVWVEFRIPETAVIWEGHGQYSRWIERYDYLQDRDWKEEIAWRETEIAVPELRREWVVRSVVEIEFDDCETWRTDGDLHGTVSQCYQEMIHQGTCPMCLAWREQEENLRDSQEEHHG